MREVVSFDDVMSFVDAFTESVTPVINGPISKASFMILAEMDPTIADELNVVTNWVNNTDIVDDNLSISNTVSDDIVDDEVVKRHYKKIKKSDVLDIARHISETYNNRKLSYVEGRLFKKYPNETEDALMDLLYKRTFSRYTDDYYIINNGVINSLGNDGTKKPETPKANTTVSLSDPVEASSIFKDAKDALKRIPEMLKKHNGDVISTITPDMTWEDISKIALTRYVLFTKGHYDNIGGGVKEILVMHVIKHENIKHNVDIRSFMKTKYKLEVSSQLVSSIKRGVVYKDIASKFGVI